MTITEIPLDCLEIHISSGPFFCNPSGGRIGKREFYDSEYYPLLKISLSIRETDSDQPCSYHIAFNGGNNWTTTTLGETHSVVYDPIEEEMWLSGLIINRIPPGSEMFSYLLKYFQENLHLTPAEDLIDSTIVISTNTSATNMNVSTASNTSFTSGPI